MALPIVPGSMVETPSSGTKLDVGPLREAALAPGRFAAALGQDVGDTFQGLSQQIQQARNDKKIFDADIAMRKTKSQFVDDLTKNPQLARDPGTWVPEWQRRSQETVDSILSQNGVGPALKKHLQQMTGIWTVDSTSEIRNKALRREVADTKKAGIVSATMAIQAGQPDQAIAAYKSMGEKGVMGPQEVAARIKAVPQQMAESQATMAIATNPIGAPDQVKQFESKLPPAKFRSIYHQAEQEQAHAQAQNAEQISGMVDDSPTHTIDEKMLKAWRDSHKLSQTGYDRIQNRIAKYAKEAAEKKTLEARTQDREERNEYNVALMRADHPPTDGTELKSWAADVKAQGLSWTNPAYRRELNEYVDRKVEHVQKTGHSFETQIQRNIFERMHAEPLDMDKQSEKEVSRRNSQGVFALSDKEMETAYPGQTREQVVRSSQAAQAKRYDQMRQWFKDHQGKDITEEQAEDYRQSLYRPSVEDMVKKALQGK